jgi:hypothetical protein
MKHHTIPHTAIDALLGAKRDPIVVGKDMNDLPPPRLVSTSVNQLIPNAVMDIGRRTYMEDTCTLGQWTSSSGRQRNVAGVFNGHGGLATITRVAQELFDMVALELETIERFPEDIGTPPEEAYCMTKALTCGFWVRV